MDFTKLESGTKLETSEGRGTFMVYKPDNHKGQTVLVKLDARKVAKWFTESNVKEIT